ncbi:c-type cytochrome [Swingsia samuiensis]|uniref:C-type cytochrome n=1 Tax=Swingsia samuiensis TaxID=1293412 RepID=A0A4Y6UI99_9PROT|nr:c-type cytochrome [Swingsia samuiensis]QDH16774.1 c-type cytochrome [Swingsia samuiensis]
MKLFTLLVLTISFLSFSEHAHAQTRDELIKAGKYLSEASDCAGCHFAANRPDFAGGQPFALPIGTLYSTNITPDPTYGIGNYTEQDFSNAVRKGIRKDGSSLYPAMPFPSYARLTDQDIHALYTYFHYGVAAAHIAPLKNKISWPLSMRWPLYFWRTFFSSSPEKAQKATFQNFSDPELQRGAYLVEGPGHCGACHTPRSFTMAEKALTYSDGKKYLSGGESIDGWTPPSLRQDNRTGLGRWSEQDIVTFLKTGRNSHGETFGAMTPAIVHGTQYLTNADLHAIAKYLKSLSPVDKNETPWTYDVKVTKKLHTADLSPRGAQIYINRCAACHRTDGAGYPDVFPPLAGNPVVMVADPASLVHIIQSGATLPSMKTAPSAITMPSFASQLSDQDIADVTTFIRQSWGNNAKAISAKTVSKLKKDMPPINMADGHVPLN